MLDVQILHVNSISLWIERIVLLDFIRILQKLFISLWPHLVSCC